MSAGGTCIKHHRPLTYRPGRTPATGVWACEHCTTDRQTMKGNT